MSEWAWSERTRQLSYLEKVTFLGPWTLSAKRNVLWWRYCKELWLCTNGKINMRFFSMCSLALKNVRRRGFPSCLNCSVFYACCWGFQAFPVLNFLRGEWGWTTEASVLVIWVQVRETTLPPRQLYRAFICQNIAPLGRVKVNPAWLIITLIG